jgi:hypothetical protein
MCFSKLVIFLTILFYLSSSPLPSLNLVLELFEGKKRGGAGEEEMYGEGVAVRG